MNSDYQNRRDIDRLMRDVYNLDDNTLKLVPFAEDSKLRSVWYKEDENHNPLDVGTIDAILGKYGLLDISSEAEDIRRGVYTKEEIDTALEDKADEIHTHSSSQITDLINVIYPVGSIYISATDLNPNTAFTGTTWVKIEDRFLLSSGTNYQFTNDSDGFADNTGGEASHTLTVNEMPSHTHTQNSHSHGTGNSTSNKFIIAETGLSRNVYKRQPPQSDSGHYFPFVDVEQPNFNTRTATGDATATNQNTGGGQAHNNMPPYLVVNVWKRTK